MYSKYLESRHDLCQELVNRLLTKFEYVSILGKQITGDSVTVTTSQIIVGDNMEQQSGFVVKMYNGKTYAEYSFSDITRETIDELEQNILNSVQISSELLDNHVAMKKLELEPLVKDFDRPLEGNRYSVKEVVDRLVKIKDDMHAQSDKIVQVYAAYGMYDVSAIFISNNRDLSQHYAWASIATVALARDGEKMQQAMDVSAHNSIDEVFAEAPKKASETVNLAIELLDAELIEPGVYDIITSPSITGLIAHEAFGHGVEMDMFVKHRAKSRHYINKEVASSLVNMHDGASATKNCVGYFFDDDGVLAHDTLIIKDGILQTGISDAVSAMQLGTEPTGNGRRQDPSRKAYTRMTNTFFAPGKDKLEDMIKSVKHGYMLFNTDNGMEDPKNWNIQCVAQYGREIKDGEFTGKIVAPVVMSGYVPDLLKSISMVSDDFEVIGSGHCGKGYKEWVPVSDGGPCLKARCKLG